MRDRGAECGLGYARGVVLSDRLDLSGLNPSQQKAVTHDAGPLMIIAGPGSGKTRVITHRIAWLVREQGVPPWGIVAVTFTNRAAREMRDRVAELLGEEAELRWLGTFHRICVRMLRMHGELIGVPQSFTIYDDDDQMSVAKRAVKELQVDSKQFGARRMLSRISRAKSEGETLETFSSPTGSYYDEIASRVWELYERALVEAQALDFDDLLIRGLELFGQEEVRERYARQFRHVLVDEFQDTSGLQYQLARAWSAGTRNLAVVGDPDQSIYSWRAADIRNLRRFRTDHDDAEEVQLNENYRSNEPILEVANAVMEGARERLPRRLRAMREGGALPVLHEAQDETDEVEYIRRRLEQGEQDGSLRASDAAVMYRTNAQSRVIEKTLRLYDIPYRLVGGTPFYNRREVRDVVAYLRLAGNSADSAAFNRVVNVPPRGIGAKTSALLAGWAEKHACSEFEAAAVAGGRGESGIFHTATVEPPGVSTRAAANLGRFVDLVHESRATAATRPLSDALRLILDRTDYLEHVRRIASNETEAEERRANVQELVTDAQKFDKIAPGAALDIFLEEVALYSDADDLPGGRPDALTLITLHQAKGLEFPCVFLIGVEENLLPHELSLDDPASIEEERRLFYVGITRAERELHLIHAFRRAYQGRSGHNPPSRYLDDIPAALLSGGARATAPVGDDVRPARNRHVRWDDMQLDVVEDFVEEEEPVRTSLAVGAGVRHETFGNGEVIDLKHTGSDFEVTVHFDDAGMKKLLASVANLTLREG